MESGATGLYPHFVGQMLAKRVARSGDRAEGIAWLQKVLATKSAQGSSITALWGLPVKAAVELTPTVSLIPISDIPESPQKRWLADIPFASLDSGIPSAFHLEQPRSALISRVVIDPLIIPPDSTTGTASGEYTQRYELFQEIALALTAVGPRVCLPAAHWFTLDDPDIQEASIAGPGRSQSLIEMLPKIPKDYPALDPAEATAVVAGYLHLCRDAQNRVRLSLSRLN